MSPAFIYFSGFCRLSVSSTLSNVMFSGILSNTSLGFLNFWILTPSSSHFAPISSPTFPSVSQIVSIISLPSLSCRSELIPTMMSLGFTFDFSNFSIISGGWLVFDLSDNRCFLSVFPVTTVE